MTTLRIIVFTSFILVSLLLGSPANSNDLPEAATFTNSIGMKFVRIEPGPFDMGFEGKPLNEEVLRYRDSDRIKTFLTNGNPDEHPQHRVSITRPFYIGVFEVTNREYEAFDRHHAKLRGKNEKSRGDDDAVNLVSWHEATAFCRWLSEKERRPYRLPTEAEWEYACRGGTTTPYYSGENLPAKGAMPNAWGLRNTHGNVEEWCQDWYGPYTPEAKTDPTGRVDGAFKVTRGGAYGTDDFYLRSANRAGTIRDDRSWIIGFRVVLGELPKTPGLPIHKEAYQENVIQTTPADIAEGPDPDKPHLDIRTYVTIPEGESGPLYYRHNHNPDIVECPNGDLLAAYFSTETEGDREMVYGGTRLRRGRSAWEPSSVFWATPDRKAEYIGLWVDGDTIHHFSSLGAYRSRPSAIVLRSSNDNGASWSEPRTISPRQHAQGVMESVIRMRHGTIVVPLDGHNVVVSYDDGATWSSPVRGDLKRDGVFGIHTPLVELTNGDIMALGRNNNINGRMPISSSSDVGQTWTHTASIFPPIRGGQRATMLRLEEGPIFFASFAKEPMEMSNGKREKAPCTGLFCALSFDDGRTWPVIQLLSDGTGREVYTRKSNYFKMTANVGEKNGYLASCQSRDGLIHLVSNRVEYAFNLKWLWQDYKPAARKVEKDRSARIGPWDVEQLFRSPSFEWIDAKKPVRSLQFRSEPYRHQAETKVFALYATPGSLTGDPSKDRDLPAVVLVHGGGGTAFREWVELWAGRGYAAVAMDLAGRGADRAPLPGGGPNQSDAEKFGAIDLPLTEQWTYHAVSNVIRAHSLLRSFPEVDAKRTAITGISWGGYLTSIVSGVDSRFKAAVPVYGCGFLAEGSAWLKQFAAMGEANTARWTRLWDPSQYVGKAKMPVFFVNGTNDFAYWLASYKKTYDLVQAPGRNLRITVRMPHGHHEGWKPAEIGLFIDEHLTDGLPLAKIATPKVSGNKIEAWVSSQSPLKKAEIHYSTADTLNPRSEWKSLPATLLEGGIEATRPTDAAAWLLTVTDERGATVSSELVIEKPDGQASS